jgi:His/Glu/Gln/Arg/opine family amino acid ABC transporter permease subunit
VIFHFEQIRPDLPYILEGTFVTLEYAGLSALCGFILGNFLAIFKISQNRLLRGFAYLYTSIFRGTPLLVQLSLIYYATPELLGYKISAFQAGILAFSLNSAAYVSETIRAGIQAIDRGQFEASAALGISHLTTLKSIILPQAIKNILPALVNESIDLVKESALVSVIGELDLLRRANIVSAKTYLFFEPLMIVAVIYYVIVMILTYVSKHIEKWMRQSDSH